MIKVQKERGAGDKWWFAQQGAQDEILLTLHSPADAIIGQYRLAVLMMSSDGQILEKMDKINFHVLFNPWCKGKRHKPFPLFRHTCSHWAGVPVSICSYR